jgi:hypothetical protein
VELYCGDLFQKCRQALRNRPPNVHILIVSAFYGLTRLEENLAKYELKMADRLWDGRTIQKFWQDERLSDFLQQYVYDHNILHVWSLLPDAQEVPYHRIFREFWRNPEGVKCYWVKVFVDNGASAGQGSRGKRGEWLNEIVMANPALLCEPNLLPKEFTKIPGVRFEYLQA